MAQLQREFNKRILLLVKQTTNKVPYLSEQCSLDEKQLGSASHTISWSEAWDDYEQEGARATAVAVAVDGAAAALAAGATPPPAKIIVDTPAVLAAPPMWSQLDEADEARR